MSLRIIGGIFRNRTLTSPKGTQTRPTLAVLRKAVFDILQTSVEDAEFLDLFAGSGAMGFEALSRGAAHATFVENNPLALRALFKNIEDLGVKEQTTVLAYDARLAINKLAKSSQSFDIVYIDPPYAPAAREKLLDQFLDTFQKGNLLKTGGTLFLEEAAPATLTLHSTSLQHVDTRKFSGTLLHQFRQSDTVRE